MARTNEDKDHKKIIKHSNEIYKKHLEETGVYPEEHAREYKDGFRRGLQGMSSAIVSNSHAQSFHDYGNEEGKSHPASKEISKMVKEHQHKYWGDGKGNKNGDTK